MRKVFTEWREVVGAKCNKDPVSREKNLLSNSVVLSLAMLPPFFLAFSSFYERSHNSVLLKCKGDLFSGTVVPVLLSFSAFRKNSKLTVGKNYNYVKNGIILFRKLKARHTNNENK